jgi:hypothetical protein
MNERRPESNSAWARYCPDAWPREWLDSSGELPEGFSRAADPREADLITGRTSEAEFVCATGRAAPKVAKVGQQNKANPVVQKVVGYRRFFDALPILATPLSPGAVSLWCWLWTCERDGLARCSVRKLATRFRCSSSTASRWLSELRSAWLMSVKRKGRTGRHASVLRVYPRPFRPRSASAPPVEQEHSSTS